MPQVVTVRSTAPDQVHADILQKVGSGDVDGMLESMGDLLTLLEEITATLNSVPGL